VAGDGNIEKLFLRCWDKIDNFIFNLDVKYDVLFPVFLLTLIKMAASHAERLRTESALAFL
jgi:hypothetical protein